MAVPKEATGQRFGHVARAQNSDFHRFLPSFQAQHPPTVACKSEITTGLTVPPGKWARPLPAFPLLWQKADLEWLYRIYQESGRMWWRYLRTNTIFAGLMLSAIVRHAK
jgi:hypothetical protein